MQSAKIEAVVGKHGTITVTGLPMLEGERVEISVQTLPLAGNPTSHPLSHLPLTYVDPFEPACPPEDWEALR